MVPPLTLRIRLFRVSAMYTLPAASTATARGPLSMALVASPPSPEKPAWPFPATVVMVPPGVTWRMRLLLRSAMYRLPLESTATPVGWLSDALVAAPPSPENPCVPLPAYVEMIPLGVSRRTRPLVRSEIYKFPALSKAMPQGDPIAALVASPPSPEKPRNPLPARTVSVPFDETRKTILLLPSAATTLPEGSRATERIWPVGALMAGWPLPLKIQLLPAVVEMIWP